LNPDEYFRPRFLIPESKEEDIGRKNANEGVALRLVGLTEVSTEKRTGVNV
jgi:hypothetical protein